MTVIDTGGNAPWTWGTAFAADDEASYPKAVRDEVTALMDHITELANLDINPSELGEKTRGTARRHTLPCGGWCEVQPLPGPRRILVVLVMPPPHLL